MAYKTGGYKTKYVSEYGYFHEEFMIYSAVESVSDTCVYKMFNEKEEEVNISIGAEDDTDDYGNRSLIDCLYYLKQRENKHYKYKEYDIIIEEMTYEEVNKIFG